MSESWARPSKQSGRIRKAGSNGEESLLTRAVAMFIAVPLFEFSLYLGLTVLFVSPRLAAYTWISLPWLFHVIYCAVVVLVAGRYGMYGITQLLGHLFLTHQEPVRDQRVTVGLWAVLCAETFVAYLLRN